MSQIAEIATIVSVTRIGNSIFVKSQYTDGSPFVSTFIADSDGILGEVNYYQGDLVVEFANFSADFYINSSGELIINSLLADYFSVNDDGQLIYNDGVMIKNLGQVSAIFKGVDAPTNTSLIWYNTGDNKQYVYDSNTSTWKAIVLISAENIRAESVVVTEGEHYVPFSSPLPSDQYILHINDYQGIGVSFVSQDAGGFTYNSLGSGTITYIATMTN